MGKLKNYMMDVQETVCDSTDLECIISESDTIEEAQNIVCNLLSHMSSYQLEIAKDYVAECWNEYWGQYV